MKKKVPARAKIIEDKIRREFTPDHLDVVNDSIKHRTGQKNPAAETHFNLLVVADAFLQLSTLDRHRLVYDLLAEEMKNGVHALSMRLYTAEEWEREAEPSIKESPDCVHT